MAVNPFSYTSRDFDSIYAEIDSLYPNKPDWFKTTIAGLFSNAHWYLDARAQNLLLSSAFTPQSILDLCAFLDYYPKGLSPASGQLVVKLDGTVTLPYILPKNQQKFTVVNPSTGTQLRLIGVEDVTFTGNYAKVKVKHGQEVDPFQIGTSTTASWQEIVFVDDSIQFDTMKVFLATSITPLILAQWQIRDTLVNSLPTDEHVRVIKKPNGLMTVQFGNGEYGKLPTANLPVYISYTKDGGINGNFLAGKTQPPTSVIGTSTGLPSQSFDIINDLVIDSLQIKVNGAIWFRVSNLLDYGATDRVFTANLIGTTGVYRVTFGDGVFGQIPNNGDVITADYKLSDNSSVTYSGSLTFIEKQYVYEDFTGGAAAETVETSRFMAPLSLKSLEKAVTEEDFEYLSKRFSTSIVKAKCLPIYYGPNTVGIHLIPAGGGNPSVTLKATLMDFLKTRTPLSMVDVRVRNPNYVPKPSDLNALYRTLTINAILYIKTGYSLADYFAYGSLVLRILVSETTTELLDLYNSQGIAAAVAYINAKWNFNSYVFSSKDYNEIVKIFDRRVKDGVYTWGGRLRPNDIISGLTDLTGSDYAEVISPTSTLSLPFDRLFTDSSIVFNLSVQVS